LKFSLKKPRGPDAARNLLDEKKKTTKEGKIFGQGEISKKGRGKSSRRRTSEKPQIGVFGGGCPRGKEGGTKKT